MTNPKSPQPQNQKQGHFTIVIEMAQLASKLLSRAVFENNGDRVSAQIVLHAFDVELKHAGNSPQNQAELYSKPASNYNPAAGLIDNSQPPESHGEYERREQVCKDAAMSQWERSLKRPDLTEKDRVIGAIEAYKRQAFAFVVLPAIGPAPQTRARGSE